MWLTSLMEPIRLKIVLTTITGHKKVITKTKIDADSLLQFFRPTKIELK